MKKATPYIIAIALLFAFLWQRERFKDERYDKITAENNARNERNLRLNDSLAFADFRFNARNDMKQYIESNKQLTQTVEGLGYKIKDVQSIVISQRRIIDSIRKAKDATPLVKYIRQGIDTSATFVFKKPCLETWFTIDYKNDSLVASLDYSDIQSNDTIIGGLFKEDKRFLGINWNWLPIYKKKAKVSIVSDCGAEIKTQIITGRLKN